MEKVFCRCEFNYDRDQASDLSGLLCEDISLTKQSFAEEVDINTIVKRFGITGEMPSGVRMPTYDDFTGVHDFHTAMNAIAQANESFDAMPAEIRSRFHNNPSEFVDFCSDDGNIEEARKLGLVPAASKLEEANMPTSHPPKEDKDAPAGAKAQSLT